MSATSRVRCGRRAGNGQSVEVDLSESNDYVIMAAHSGTSFTSPGYPMHVLLSILRNNITPYGEEREAILSFIAEQRNSIDQEIDRPQGPLNYLLILLKHRNELELCERSISAPIRKLPLELLERIFLLCRDTEAYDSYGMIDAYSGSPVLRAITSVSYHWNLVANSYSLLWSRFMVESVRSSRGGYRSRIHMREFVKSCIRKSGDALLRFQLECTETDLGSELFTMLSQTIHRWDTAIVTVKILDELELLLPGNPSFPHLRVLSVDGSFIGHTMFKDSPKLTRLELRFFNKSPEKKFNLIFPWSQITDLLVNGTLEDDSILKLVNRLSSLTFRGDIVITRALPVSLPHLQCLTLCGTGDVELLVHIIAPCLKEFIINFRLSGNNNDLSRFLSRCAHSLEQLTVVNLPLAAAENLTMLKHLTILGHSPPIDDLYHLSRTSRSSDMFPRLESFTLYISSMFIYDRRMSQALIYMIKSRIPERTDEISSVTYLRTLTIIVSENSRQPDRYDPEFLAFIHSDEVKRAGLVISIK